MSYLTSSLGFATHKINRKFNIKVRLYFNENSWNRDVDSTPRFWLDAQSIVDIEGLAFTEKSISKTKRGYVRHGHRAYDNVGCPIITDNQVEAIFSDLQKNYPYGFRENDSSSKQKYIADARDNDEFQGHWANYWKNNSSKIVPVSGNTTHIHPYIEFQTSEHIATKHNIGTVPTIEGGSPLPVQEGSYRNVVIKNQVWREVLSDAKVLDVSIPTGTYDEETAQEDLVFSIEGGQQKNIILDGENETAYALRFVDPWPTGVGGAYSGVAFRISETDDGENSTSVGGAEYLNVSAGSFSHETTTYAVTVTNSKFYIDGVEAPALTMKRGSKYVFDISDNSVATHDLFISTSATGGDGKSSEHCHVQEANSGISVTFRVPFDAPNTLYYECSLHSSMGNSINIVSPTIDFPAINSSYLDVTPGDGLRIILPSATDDRSTLYYYGVLNANMGGAMFSRDCVIKCPNESPGKIGGIGEWDPTYY